jgi:hypothetical protein
MANKAVRAYIETDLAAALARQAQARSRSASSIISEAVRAYFVSKSEDVTQAETETVRRQLNRVEARLDKLIWEQAQQKECLLLFVRVWLEHNPPLDDAIEESAAISAEARFERFLDLLSQDLTSAHPLGDLDGRIGVNGADGVVEGPSVAASAP